MLQTHTHTHRCSVISDWTVTSTVVLSTDLYFVSSSWHLGHVAHYEFGCDSFSSSTFSTERSEVSAINVKKQKQKRLSVTSTNRISIYNNMNSVKPRPPDDDTLVLVVYHHVSVHVVGQSVDVGWVLILGLWSGLEWGAVCDVINSDLEFKGHRLLSYRALVQLHLSVCEVGKLFKRIHWDQDWTDVGLTGAGSRTEPEPGPGLSTGQCIYMKW